MNRTFVSLCLYVFVFSSTLAAQDSSLRLPAFSKFQLRNGMTVLLLEQHEVPIISFSMIIKAGSTSDPQNKEGLASLTADLLRKGTRSRTSDQISNDLDFIGGEFDMGASTDFTAGSAEFLKKDIRQGLDLVTDIILNPVFPQEEVTKRIRQLTDEIKSAKDRADSVIGRYFFAYLYGKHPYGRPVDGDEVSLAAITRQDVQRFYETNYVPANMILAAAGDFSAGEMRGLLEQRFNSWPAKTPSPVRIDEPRPVQGKRLLLVDKPDSTQTYFYIGNVGITRMNPDRVAIGVVNTLFGGRFTSKLNTALRIDSGLTYGARSSFDQRKLAGPFTIATYTRNATTEKAVDMALEVLANLHEKGITAEELASAKAYLKGQFPTSIETSSQLASTIARLEFFGLDENDINSYYSKVDAMTMSDARRIIEQYFPKDNLVFVLIGKAGEIQSLAKKYAPSVDTRPITQPGF
ncbi:MAG TPA: pitrilysin family protein [Terriglobia bacterium]|nr:pitrilysin family protein [Terriglobia bacterium]